jgi:hypothetical protein
MRRLLVVVRERTLTIYFIRFAKTRLVKKAFDFNQFPYTIEYSNLNLFPPYSTCNLKDEQLNLVDLNKFYRAQYVGGYSMRAMVPIKVTDNNKSDIAFSDAIAKLNALGNLIANLTELSTSSISSRASEMHGLLIGYRREYKMILRDFKVQELSTILNRHIKKLKSKLLTNPDLAEKVAKALEKNDDFIKANIKFQSTVDSIKQLSRHQKILSHPIANVLTDLAEKLKEITRIGSKAGKLLGIFDLVLKGVYLTIALFDEEAREAAWEDPKSASYKFTALLISAAIFAIALVLLVKVSLIIGVAFVVSTINLGITDLYTGKDNLTNAVISFAQYTGKFYEEMKKKLEPKVRLIRP